MQADQVSRFAIGQFVDVIFERPADRAGCEDPSIDWMSQRASTFEHRLSGDPLENAKHAARTPMIVDRTALAGPPAEQLGLVRRPGANAVAAIVPGVEAQVVGQAIRAQLEARNPMQETVERDSRVEAVELRDAGVQRRTVGWWCAGYQSSPPPRFLVHLTPPRRVFVCKSVVKTRYWRSFLLRKSPLVG